MTTKPNAVEIRGLHFNYKNNIKILKGIDMTVPKGFIFQLPCSFVSNIFK